MKSQRWVDLHPYFLYANSHTSTAREHEPRCQPTIRMVVASSMCGCSIIVCFESWQKKTKAMLMSLLLMVLLLVVLVTDSLTDSQSISL